MISHCFTNGADLQKSMSQSAVRNARFVDMETYAFAWSRRISEWDMEPYSLKVLSFDA